MLTAIEKLAESSLSTVSGHSGMPPICCYSYNFDMSIHGLMFSTQLLNDVYRKVDPPFDHVFRDFNVRAHQ